MSSLRRSPRLQAKYKRAYKAALDLCIELETALLETKIELRTHFKVAAALNLDVEAYSPREFHRLLRNAALTEQCLEKARTLLKATRYEAGVAA